MQITATVRQATQDWINSVGGVTEAAKILNVNRYTLYNIINGKTTDANRISDKLKPLIMPYLPRNYKFDSVSDDVLKLRRTIMDKVKTLDKDKLLKVIEFTYKL